MRWLALLLSLLVSHGAFAEQLGAVAGVASVNGCTGNCTVQPGNFVGTYQVGTLPSCNNTTTPYGSIAYVTDLGGGANNAKCIAGAWQHFTMGVPGSSAAASGTVTITPLVSPPILQLTGTIALATTLTLQIQTANLYPGYQVTIIAPPTILGSLLMTVQGVAGLNLSILGGARSSYVWNGTTLVQTQ